MLLQPFEYFCELLSIITRHNYPEKKKGRKSARSWLKKANRFKQCVHLQKTTLDKK